MLTLLLLVTNSSAVFAAQSSSTHYEVNEVYFGAGGDLNDCSADYCAKTSAGDLTVGNTKSADYQAQGGFNTDRTPSLTFTVTAGSTDLGYLSTSATKTATATFSVKTYLASGYVVQIMSNSPIDNLPGHHLLNPLATPTASSTGVEQFGINLVANTTACGAPTTFGANPIQVPSSSFSYGTAASGYNTCGLFKYVNGDTIALSNKSSGETDYTMSFIFNISNVTPDGFYAYNGVLVATSTF
jgi:hypothetical protein